MTLFYSAVLPASRWISESQHSLSLSDIKQTDSKMLATHWAHSLSPPQACPGSGWEAGSVARRGWARLCPLPSAPCPYSPCPLGIQGKEKSWGAIHVGSDSDSYNLPPQVWQMATHWLLIPRSLFAGILKTPLGTANQAWPLWLLPTWPPAGQDRCHLPASAQVAFSGRDRSSQLPYSPIPVSVNLARAGEKNPGKHLSRPRMTDLQ